MRGKAKIPQIAALKCRITPAYAGKSKTIAGEAFKGEDHPRLCGEKDFLSSSQMAAVGSPPPMRGKDAKCSSPFSSGRITPAYAGKSYPEPSQRW